VKPLRILYHHRTRGDGAEGIHIAEMISAFEAQGHQVRLACPWTAKKNQGLNRKQSNTIAISGLGWKRFLKQLAELLYNLISFLRVSYWSIRFRPDFIYERYSAFHCGGVIAAKVFRVPLVLEVNATYAGKFGCRFPVYFPRALLFCERVALRTSAIVVVVSNALRDCVTEQGVLVGRVLVLPNAINEQKCIKAKESSSRMGSKLKSELGIDSEFVIGFVGSLRKWHGIDLLIDAIPSVIRECPEAQFLIIGSGEMESSLKEFVEKERLWSKVILHPAVEHDQVFDYLNLVTVGLMPDSNQFGSPMKILEYMAMGVVPVAPDVEPIREIIQNHETGIVFKQRCVSEFVESISMLYRDEKLRLRVAQQASSYVLGNRLWRINAEKTISAIKPFL